MKKFLSALFDVSDTIMITVVTLLALLLSLDASAQDYSSKEFASGVEFSGKISYLTLDTTNLIVTGKIVSSTGEKWFSYNYGNILREVNVDNFFIRLQTLNNLMFCYQNNRKLTMAGILNNNQFKVYYIK